MSRKKPYTVLCLGTVLVLLALAASAQELPKAGDKLGKISFTAPVSAEDLAYLGVGKGAKEFTLDQIKAPLVVLQLFSMYCTYCQEEAPQVNEFYKLINQKGLGDKIKIFGVGIKNSRMEANLFRKKFKVAFPLLPDPEGIVHGQLGKPDDTVLCCHRQQGRRRDYIHPFGGDAPRPRVFCRALSARPV